MLRPLLLTCVCTCLLATAAPSAGAATSAGTITWTRSGGIAGVSQEMTISRDRRVKLTTDAGTKRRTLSRKRYAAIVRVVRDAKLPTLRTRYAPKLPTADGFATSVRYRGRTVTVLDGAKPPRRLQAVLGTLGALAAELTG